MQGLTNLLSGFAGGDAAMIIAMVMVFAFVMLFSFGVYTLVTPYVAAGRRLDPEAARTARNGGPRAVSIRFGQNDRPWTRWLGTLGQRVSKEPAETLVGDRVVGIRQRLIQAGFFSPSAVSVYYGLRVVLAIIFCLLVVGVGPFASDAALGSIFMTAGMAAVLGMFGPMIYVTLRIRTRQRLFREGFPDTMDMMLVCVEAGLGLDATIDRVAREMKSSHPIISQQLEMMSAELRAGRRRDEALRGMSDRIGIDEVSSLATLLVQSEKLGASLSDTLRAHAEDMRAKRLLRAEEKANRLPVMLSIPVVLFVLPALMVTALTPAIIKVVRDLLPTMSGQQ
jgi:tight adherence protein C